MAEGFSTIDDIKDTDVENLTKIEGIEEDTAKALIERAKEFYQKDQEDIAQRIKDLGLADDLINLKGLNSWNASNSWRAKDIKSWRFC